MKNRREFGENLKIFYEIVRKLVDKFVKGCQVGKIENRCKGTSHCHLYDSNFSHYNLTDLDS